MTREAARTGAGPTALVAIEHNLPPAERIVDDALAAAFLPPVARVLAERCGAGGARWLMRATERKHPGLWGGVLCRKRYIDEALHASSPQMEALVNLGAGFDTRAFRPRPAAALPAWELDQAANIEAKRRRAVARFGKVPAHVQLVAIDFEHESIAAVLAARGYGRARRTFFIWEGVTQYLDEAGVRATLDFLATAAPGSRLALTYVLKDFLAARELYGAAAMHRRFVARQSVWRFGLDPQALPSFLASYGWRVLEHPEAVALERRFIAPTGRALTCMPLERCVLAQRVT
ncbi:SAM-dependent methyltransferase [Paraburkholderia unamae]|uniref:S-adenosyl-L-methionine-dependent methyltransferase n=1 Tax=Paraburkholderia unamae TaxID=219649 RepID=A0ABX5KU77_9BURK|nr:SAM-dependent methyltransferase [Paraburkholderia unamae]PVX84765.1 methyltransferase (TIGR00027 family) [Paraburkholderia unamae]CAG9246228.1 S-adenosyl-L-methionine-dependent methyltransferase [Paraburkholderia unamae]